MKNQDQPNFKLEMNQLNILEKISGVWSNKCNPEIPCFQITRYPDGYYKHIFLDDDGDVVSDPALLFINPQLHVLIPDNNQILIYDDHTDELIFDNKAFVRFDNSTEAVSHLRQGLADVLLAPDNQDEKEATEFNRKIILSWICGKWKPVDKDNIPNIHISKSIPMEYEIRFVYENHHKLLSTEAFTIQQDYEAFFFYLKDNCLEIIYFPAVDQIRVGATYYERVTIQQQEI